MLKFSSLLLLSILCGLTVADTKRRATAQTQHNLGDFCMPGTCASVNSNCKRIGGNAFRCVCKDQFMAVNKTNCVRIINASIDEDCASCTKRNGICLDEDADNHVDKCFCPIDNAICNDHTTSYLMAVTQPFRKNMGGTTPIFAGRVSHQGELVLGLYNVNQQRLIDNGGSVFIGDRLFLEIKYRTGNPNGDRHQIIAENCSIASSVSDNEVKLEKIQLLTNRCPSVGSRLSTRFQRIDPYHVKSSVFQISKFETTSVVYVRCSIGICVGRIEQCQERMCPDVQQPFPHRGANGSAVDTVDYADDDSASVLALRRRRGRRQDTPEEEEEKISRLINEITRSIDQIPSSSSNFIDVMDDHYEVRQVQQQFTIEVALPQPSHKHKVPYDALYGRTSLGTQGAVERSTVLAAISIIFIIGISVSLFIIYRTCYIEYVQRIYGSRSFAGFINGGESTYAGVRSNSRSCRYDMGRRSEQRFDESVFVSNVEPISAYRRQY